MVALEMSQETMVTLHRDVWMLVCACVWDTYRDTPVLPAAGEPFGVPSQTSREAGYISLQAL